MINTKIRQILQKYQKISDENRWIEQNLPIYSIGCMNTDWAQYNSESMIGVWRQFNNVSAISLREQVNFQSNDDEVHFVLDQHA